MAKSVAVVVVTVAVVVVANVASALKAAMMLPTLQRP
jgi:hypothetical protein